MHGCSRSCPRYRHEVVTLYSVAKNRFSGASLLQASKVELGSELCSLDIGRMEWDRVERQSIMMDCLFCSAERLMSDEDGAFARRSVDPEP